MRSEDVISVARRILPHGEGFAALVERLDTNTAEMRLELLLLGPDGSRREGFPAPSEGRTQVPGLWSSLPASLMVEGVRRAEGVAAEALADVAMSELLEIAADDRTMIALVGPRGSPDRRGQALRRIRLSDGSARELDLRPLRLGRGRAISGIALHDGWLHAFVADPVAGFDLFRAPADEEEPVFLSLIREGAGRFALNAAVSAVATDAEGLLLGTAALAPGASHAGGWGAELIRLRPDGEWELIVGQPRLAADGLRRPRSGYLPGFGEVRNAAVKAMAVADGHTYLLLQDFEGEPVLDRRDAAPDFLDYMGPARLLCSPDLRNWSELNLPWPEGLGAMTAFAVSPLGLLVGHEQAGMEGTAVTLIPRA